ncbi:translation initiation factor eIF-2B subunit beta [Leptidea sinapis]|uniref:translation initiation factor eIF-2B subunit beta n=1 Tax=Leptidea sinapis TaxID=189913 RepID=UPI0021318025|nr:translation initiation factor eIF-2B subunit beta [Leptidea sinapis]
MPPLDSMQELDDKSIENIVRFVTDVRTGKLKGSNKIASASVDLLEQIIIEASNTNALSLINAVRGAGRRLINALPQELVVANMVRRVMRAIRDEQRALINQSSECSGESLQRLVLAAPSRRATLPSHQDMREPIRDHIAELQAELEASTSSICGQAKEHIHADELILTYGASSLVEKFLKACGTKRFKLLLVESPEVNESAAMAARLSAYGINVTLVNGCAVGALMSRVNKVVVGGRATLAGGAVLGEGGLLTITTVAAHFTVPVIVLSPLYKLSPLHSSDHSHFEALAPPYTALPYMTGESGTTQVFAPVYDFVPPDHVTLFITNLSGSSPSYIYRLLSELYDPNDYQI